MLKESSKDLVKNGVQGAMSKLTVVITRTMTRLGRERRIDVYSGGCYVRLSSLELVAKEIYEKDVSGAVAELGVFRGRFAKKINEAFPDRALYLFDTFEGFDNRDVPTEKINNYSEAAVDLTGTSVELVISQMRYRDKCIVKKGYFPKTASDVNEEFAFVSIDTDLYKPIYEGLHFFYPKLSSGGYIFVHDYNNHEFKGAKQAVREFCDETSTSYFPLSDFAGSAVIAKP
ncbi:MAG: TylF/MycF/NovP-related O-methyltransferase [Thermoleophilia bacterium]